MAKINGSEKNESLIKQVAEKLETILRTSEKMDDDLVVVIEGKKVLEDEKDKYLKLKEVSEILDFKDKDETSLYAFEDIYLEKSKQERLFALANDNELGLTFPNVFGQYGEIPNHPGVKCPRPKSLLETMEAYEEYLGNYYAKHKINAVYDEKNVRLPYPHERFEWNKGTAIEHQNDDYTHPAYKEYVAWQEAQKNKGASNTSAGSGNGNPTNTGTETKKTATAGDTDTPSHTEGNDTTSDGPDLEGDSTNRKKKSEERTKKRKNLFERLREGTKRRVYPKEKKSLKDYLLAPFRKIQEADATLANGENWPKIKRLLVGAAVVVGGAALIATVGGPLISTVLTGILNWPTMLAGALTGTMATSGGGMIALSAMDRIVMGLVGAAVPAGIITSIYKIVKAKKKAVPEDEKGPKGPTDNVGDDDEKDKGKDKGKEKGQDKGQEKGKGKGQEGGSEGDDDTTGDEEKGKGTKPGQDDEPIVIEGDTFEQRVLFIATKLAEINKELEGLQLELAQINTQTTQTDLTRKRIELIQTRVTKLNLMKKKYQIELMKLTGYTETQDMGEQDLSSGGMSK